MSDVLKILLVQGVVLPFELLDIRRKRLILLQQDPLLFQQILLVCELGFQLTHRLLQRIVLPFQSGELGLQLPCLLAKDLKLDKYIDVGEALTGVSAL